jgi:hypothetical protein
MCQYSSLLGEATDVGLLQICIMEENELLAFPSSFGGISKATKAALSSANKNRSMHYYISNATVRRYLV